MFAPPAGLGGLSPSTGASALGGLPGAGAAGLPAAAPAAQPSTIWSFLGLSGSNLQACQAKICASQVGQMLNSLGTGPVAGMTGGFLPSLCPPSLNPSQIAGLQQQPGGAAAAAEQIKASEANAKARVAAVEYLGTVDCTRWPEARKALIYSLREDPNECVRFAAARALNSGCCCNQEVIEALRICVSGEAKGNAPPETSCRVKASAFSALQNCLLRVPEDLPPEVPPEPPIKPVAPERATQNKVDSSHLATSYSGEPRGPSRARAEERPKTFAQTVDDARRTLFAVSRSPRPPGVLTTGRRSLFDALTKAREDADNAKLRHSRAQEKVNRATSTIDDSAEPPAYTLAAAADRPSSNPNSASAPASTPADDEDGPAPSVDARRLLAVASSACCSHRGTTEPAVAHPNPFCSLNGQ